MRFEFQENKKGLDFRFGEAEVGAKRSRDGVVFFNKGAPDWHLTMNVDANGIRAHLTPQGVEQFAGEDVRLVDLYGRTTLFVIRYRQLERLMSKPAYVEELRNRILRGYRPLRTPRQLEVEGGCFLVPLAVSLNEEWQFVSTLVAGEHILVAQPITVPWNTPPGATWFAGTSTGQCVGLVFSTPARPDRRVHLLRARETTEAGEWLLRTITSPSYPFCLAGHLL